MKKPIQLAGIKGGGCSNDGDAVYFELESRGGKISTFSMPSEAISEVIEKLMVLAQTARKQRGSPNVGDEPVGKKSELRARTATSVATSAARQGIVLTIECGPLRHDILLPPEMNIQLSEGLVQSHTEWLKLYPPN